MLNSTRVYSFGICTGAGVSLTLLAIGSRLGVVAPDALLDFGCLFAGIFLLLIGNVRWVRYYFSADASQDSNHQSSSAIRE
jgi:hypothetical protein